MFKWIRWHVRNADLTFKPRFSDYQEQAYNHLKGDKKFCTKANVEACRMTQEYIKDYYRSANKSFWIVFFASFLSSGAIALSGVYLACYFYGNGVAGL